MPINPDVALNATLDPIEFSWSSSDIQLYHLGLARAQIRWMPVSCAT
jgi:hypothetical protein